MTFRYLLKTNGEGVGYKAPSAGLVRQKLLCPINKCSADSRRTDYLGIGMERIFAGGRSALLFQ